MMRRIEGGGHAPGWEADVDNWNFSFLQGHHQVCSGGGHLQIDISSVASRREPPSMVLEKHAD